MATRSATDATLWVDDLYAEVRAHRDALPEHAPIRSFGFSILFAPPRPGQPLFMGINPRRSSADFAKKNPEGMLRPPATHLYDDPERGGDLGKELRRMVFRRCAGAYNEQERGEAWKALTGSNKTNFWFFGSRSIKNEEGGWMSDASWGGRAHRVAIEKASVRWRQTLLEHLAPPLLVTEGLFVHDKLSRELGRKSGCAQLEAGKHKVGQSSIRWSVWETPWGSMRTLGLPHPTGSRVSTRGREIMSIGLTGCLLGLHPRVALAKSVTG